MAVYTAAIPVIVLAEDSDRFARFYNFFRMGDPNAKISTEKLILLRDFNRVLELIREGGHQLIVLADKVPATIGEDELVAFERRLRRIYDASRTVATASFVPVDGLIGENLTFKQHTHIPVSEGLSDALQAHRVLDLIEGFLKGVGAHAA